MGDQRDGGIAWTDETWNPTRGCSRISPGCERCYAEVMAARFSDPGYWGHGFAERTPKGPRWTRMLALVADKLDAPLHWRKPRRIFVNSTSDLFHEALSDEAIAAVFGVMAKAHWHTFQVLTKRAERMRRFLAEYAAGGRHVWEAAQKHPFPSWAITGAEPPSGWPLRNVWLGVSVEDQQRADERIPHLLSTSAVVRWVSYEPALGPVDFTSIELPPEYKLTVSTPARINALTSQDDEHFWNDHPRIDWLVQGGESGPGARPYDLAWARSTIRQCREFGVPCFTKQLGASPRWSPDGEQWWNGPHTNRDGSPRFADRKGGDMAEWPEDLRVREFPEVAA